MCHLFYVCCIYLIVNVWMLRVQAWVYFQQSSIATLTATGGSATAL